jgi:hypothetical protein
MAVMREHIFVNRFLQAVYEGVLDKKLTSFTNEACFHLSGRISAENNRYWSSINLRQNSDMPLHNQKIERLLLHEAQDLHFLKHN